MNDRALTPKEAADRLKQSVANYQPEFALALPPHIPPERFVRVVQTAILSNPRLMQADRVSLFEAAQKAAQDGLLPDGKEGALVVFNTRQKDENGQWHSVAKVQWMPMVAGILKKIRNSGELLWIRAHVVGANDEFDLVLGDEERLHHKPNLDDPGEPRFVYAIASTKDGGIYREVMSKAQVEKVRAVSRSKDDGPWVDWWEAMAIKTVIRRLAKTLPMSSDLDDLVRRDDALYDFDNPRKTPAGFEPVQGALTAAPRPRIVGGSGRPVSPTGPDEGEPARAPHAAGSPSPTPHTIEHEPDQAPETVAGGGSPAAQASDVPPAPPAPAPGVPSEAAPKPETLDPADMARRRGHAVGRSGRPRRLPGEYEGQEFEHLARAFLEGFEEGRQERKSQEGAA